MFKEYKSAGCLSDFYIPLVNNSRFSCSDSIFLGAITSMQFIQR